MKGVAASYYLDSAFPASTASFTSLKVASLFLDLFPTRAGSSTALRLRRPFSLGSLIIVHRRLKPILRNEQTMSQFHTLTPGWRAMD
jgi:hypothetical protein